MKCKMMLVFVATAATFSPGLAQHPPESNKLTLKRAAALAVQNSAELKQARAQQAVAERNTGLSKSVFLPNLYTGSGAAYTNGFPLGAPTVFDLSYQQTVFNPPMRGEFRAAEARAESQRLEADKVRDDVVLRTVSTCLELFKVRRTLELMRRESDSARKISDVTRQRAAEGFELPIDVTRAELTAARIHQRVLQLEGRAELLESQIRLLTGLPAGQPIELDEEELPGSEEKSPAELLELAINNSIELKQAELERKAREHRWKGEKGGYLPTLDFVGQYGIFSRFNNYDQFYNRFERHNVTIGIQAKIPIFASRTSAAVSLARSELRASEAEADRKRGELEVEVRRAARRTREASAAREVARLELKLAQENLQVMQARFEEGKITLRDLEKARLEEHDRWQAFLDAGFERQQAQLQLMRLTGQLARVFQ